MVKSLITDSFISPAGVAKFPELNTPSTFFDKDGEYKVTLLLPEGSQEADLFIKMLDDIVDECFQAEKEALIKEKKHRAAQELQKTKVPYRKEYDKEGNLTGNVEFFFSCKAKRDGVTKVFPKIDAKRQVISENIKVTGGSIIKAAVFYKSIYANSFKKAGAKFYLQAVQVIELKSYTGGSDGTFGFTEEDGFESASVAVNSNFDFNEGAEELQDNGENVSF